MTAPSRPRDFLTGIGFLGRGLAVYARNPGLVLLGMLPALMAFVVLVTGFGAVLYFLGPESRALTGFAHGWPAGARELVQALAEAAIVVVSVFLVIIVYTGLTLLIIDALAAALIGGLVSLPLTVLGGFILGLLETYPTIWIQSLGFPRLVALLVILAVLVVRNPRGFAVAAK